MEKFSKNTLKNKILSIYHCCMYEGPNGQKAYTLCNGRSLFDHQMSNERNKPRSNLKL